MSTSKWSVWSLWPERADSATAPRFHSFTEVAYLQHRLDVLWRHPKARQQLLHLVCSWWQQQEGRRAASTYESRLQSWPCKLQARGCESPGCSVKPAGTHGANHPTPPHCAPAVICWSLLLSNRWNRPRRKSSRCCSELPSVAATNSAIVICVAGEAAGGAQGEQVATAHLAYMAACTAADSMAAYSVPAKFAQQGRQRVCSAPKRLHHPTPAASRSPGRPRLRLPPPPAGAARPAQIR